MDGIEEDTLVKPIQYTDRGAHITLAGRITADEYLAANRQLMNHPDYARQEYSLWEYEDGATLECNGQDVRNLALADRDASLAFPGRKVAVVAPEPLIFGLSRMYAGFFHGGAWQVSTFTKIEDARHWLGLTG